jgi:chaperonin GroES
MKLKPLTNNVIIKPETGEKETGFGIVLPDTMKKERPEQGEVVAVGPGKTLDNGQTVPCAVKVGDQVVFKKYAPDEIKIDDQDYLIVSESDIVAVLEK